MTSMWQGLGDGSRLDAREPMDGESLSLLALLLLYKLDGELKYGGCRSSDGV
jgi:hypothetical protein